MADFNPKKLQVFVSSTYEDLIPERQAAVEAILTAGHIPAGMELFTAGDESQMEVIKQWIDESDVYLLILGGRYGSIEPKTGRSYIELEYEYTVSKSKPFFACVLNEAATDARVKAKGTSVIELENPQKLKQFRAQVLTKMCKFWEDTKDIKIAITETLSQFTRRENLTGWVRSNTQSNVPALADEIARLSKENAQLRNQLASTTKEDLINGIKFDVLIALLEQQGALAFLLKHAAELSISNLGVMGRQPREVEELCLRGLIRQCRGISPPHYELTDSGRILLNKVHAQRLASKTESPPITANPSEEASQRSAPP
jgi:hypothetical protein